jgi:hypothetical protein
MVDTGVPVELAGAVARLPVCETTKKITNVLESFVYWGVRVELTSQRIFEDVSAAWHAGSFNDGNFDEEEMWGLFEVKEYVLNECKWTTDALPFLGSSNLNDEHSTLNAILRFNSEDLMKLNVEDAEDICETLTRCDDLRKSFAPHGLEIRADSRMCEEYILFLDGDVDEITVMMLEMRFFFDKTTYETLRRHGTSEIAKLAALHKYDGDVKMIPPNFEETTYIETLSAWRAIQDDISFEAKKQDGHACVRCNAWKDITDEEYCSMCESSDDDEFFQRSRHPFK